MLGLPLSLSLQKIFTEWGAAYPSLGFEDENLGSSPWLVGRYCNYLLRKQTGGN